MNYKKNKLRKVFNRKVLIISAAGLVVAFAAITAISQTGVLNITKGDGTSLLYVGENPDNVGIGTTNPTEKLDVVGNGRFDGDLIITGGIDPRWLRFIPQTSPPSENTGMVYYNDNDDELYVYDGSNWQPLGVPSGVIVMWSGSIANIPDGWALCDGTNGTPDLTGRFIVHADADAGGTYNPGDIGGENAHTLTVAEMPSHSHSYNIGKGGDFAGNVHKCPEFQAKYWTDYTGGDEAHENRPPYFALAYIMKL